MNIEDLIKSLEETKEKYGNLNIGKLSEGRYNAYFVVTPVVIGFRHPKTGEFTSVNSDKYDENTMPTNMICVC